MSGHTPGPWRVATATETGKPIVCAIEGPDAGMCIAEINSWRQVANGYLIAAAPEMLQALEWIIDEYESNIDTNEGPSDEPIPRWARAAIAKAKGKR